MIEKKKVKRKPRGRKIRKEIKKPAKKPETLRKPTLIGYMRVSTEKQDHSLQHKALIEAGVEEENIFQDTISGSRVNRKGRDECLKYLIEGDTLVVWKLDRFSRSLKDLLTKLDELEQKGVGFKTLTQNIDTTTPAGRMMMQIVGAFAEFEREMIRERVKAGIQEKMKNSKQRWGKRPAVDYSEKEIKKLIREGLTQRQVAKQIGVSKSTVQRIYKTMRIKKR